MESRAPFIKTKIVATAGPACRSPEAIARLIGAGVDVFRLNFSHGTLADHAAVLSAVRAEAARLHAAVAVLGDLGGPKIRIGQIAAGRMDLPAGATLTIQRDPIAGADGRVSCSYPQLVEDVHVGEAILIADGRLRLRVAERRAGEVVCRVEVGGVLEPHKGVNLPGTRISSPAVTDKDARDLAWAVEHGVDWLALSFVRRAADLEQLKGRLADLGAADLPVIAKIEKPEALEELDAIIAAADGVMVARGDLGVELELARVPLAQKEITARCHAAAVPVVIATQMLSSMTAQPTATRAEVSDVANAVFDRADACMLSEETAVGAYPAEAVETMARVAEQVEAFLDARFNPAPAGGAQVAGHVAQSVEPAAGAAGFVAIRSEPFVLGATSPAACTPAAGSGEVAFAVTAAAAAIASAADLRCVVAWTASGATARLLSKRRLGVPILAFSPSEATANRMALFYGVCPHRMDRPTDEAAMLKLVDREVCSHGLAAAGELILIVSGANVAAPGQTNALMIHRVGGPGPAE